MTKQILLLTAVFSNVLISCTDSPGQDDYSLFSQGTTCFYSADYEKALFIFEEMFHKFPEFTENTKMYALTLYRTGRENEAVGIWESCINDSPSDLDTIKRLCTAYLEREDYRKAESLVESGFTITSEDPMLFYLKARILIADEEMDSALALLQSALSLMEKQIVIPLELARIYSTYGLQLEASQLVSQYSVYLSSDHPLTSALHSLRESTGIAGE